MADFLTNLFAQFRGDLTEFASNLCVLLVFIGAFCGALAMAGCIAEFLSKEAEKMALIATSSATATAPTATQRMATPTGESVLTANQPRQI